MRKMKVVADTNFLLMPFQFKINLDAELRRLFGKYEVYVPSAVLEELENIGATDAKAALKLASRYRVVKCPECMEADECVLWVAKSIGGAVMTNDKVLREWARREGLAVVYMRGKSHLVCDGVQ